MSLSTATIDQETADRLSAEFHACFSDFAARDDLFAPDTFFDLLPPMWRFQFVGSGEAFTTQLRSIAEGPVDIVVVRTVPTSSGFVTEHVETQQTRQGPVTARRIHLCKVRRRSDLRGHDLLQRRLGRRASSPSCRRSPHGPALTWRLRTRSSPDRTPSDDHSFVPKLHRHRCRELPALLRPGHRDASVSRATERRRPTTWRARPGYRLWHRCDRPARGRPRRAPRIRDGNRRRTRHDRLWPSRQPHPLDPTSNGT